MAKAVEQPLDDLQHRDRRTDGVRLSLERFLQIKESVRAGHGILRLLLDGRQEESDPVSPSPRHAHGEEEIVVLPPVLLEVRGDVEERLRDQVLGEEEQREE
jgi:hypothetical protein